MPLVKPNYSEAGSVERLEPGRYIIQAREVAESDRTDKNGNNSLVVKFEVVMNKNTKLNGKKVSKWLPLAGVGAKVLFRFMKCIDANYSGAPFTTESILGKIIEADLVREINPKDGKEWIKVGNMYPYLPAGSVGITFAQNVADEKDVPDFDSFDQ